MGQCSGRMPWANKGHLWPSLPSLHSFFFSDCVNIKFLILSESLLFFWVFFFSYLFSFILTPTFYSYLMLMPLPRMFLATSSISFMFILHCIMSCRRGREDEGHSCWLLKRVDVTSGLEKSLWVNMWIHIFDSKRGDRHTTAQ